MFWFSVWVTDHASPHSLSLSLQMLSSMLFAGIGVVGAGYSVIVSAVAINRGPKCSFFLNSTTLDWGYPFSNGWDIENNQVLKCVQ